MTNIIVKPQTIIMSNDIETMKKIITQGSDGISLLISTDGVNFNEFYCSDIGENYDGDHDPCYIFSHNVLTLTLSEIKAWCVVPNIEIV